MKFYWRLLISLLIILILFFIYYHYYSKEVNSQSKVLEKSFKSEQEKDPEIFITSDKYHRNYSKKNKIENIFQQIDFSEKISDGYVYSAYYDKRDVKKVVIISILKYLSRNYQCILWFQSNSSITVKANVISIPEGSGRLYTASYIVCLLDNFSVPKFVSVVEERFKSIENIIRVNSNRETNLSRTFAVCVTPFNLKYNKVDQFIEMISFNQLMGASHIYFYNYSIGPDVERLLQKFIKDRFVTVIPWPLPMRVHVWPIPPNYEEEIKYFGQMAMLNDCLFRNKGVYKYLVFADLDEFLVPRSHRNWNQLFDEVIDKKYSSAKAWLFRNIFFKTEWPSDSDMENNGTIKSLNAMSLLKVRRERTIYNSFERSKLIIDPLSVYMMGVHNVWNFQSAGTVGILSPEEGLCHHYRFWEGMGEKTFEIDKNIFRLREDLVAVLQRNRKFLK